ncbi:MAG TPA: hypothetical protein VFV87_06965 [Pirellulaceae bacterium]|nr:hypothetical protein [Pirellulaceae bacterium]
MLESEAGHSPEVNPYASPHEARAQAAPPQTLVGKVLAIAGVLVSLLFLSNLTFGGIIPLEIPDALPVIGNLDEVFFTGVLLASLSYLGVPLIPNFRAAGQAYSRLEGPKR